MTLYAYAPHAYFEWFARGGVGGGGGDRKGDRDASSLLVTVTNKGNVR